MELKWTNTLPRSLILTGFVFCVLSVSKPSLAVEVFADSEIVVENGTAGVLRCTFKSSEVVSAKITVSWSFQSNQPDTQFSKAAHGFFYFSNNQADTDPKVFQDRVQFVGDINKKDASIRINPTQFSDNGTYFCAVKNPPDISGTQARVELRVVSRGSLPQSNTPVIVGAVCGALFLLVLILISICVVMKVLHNRNDYEGCITLESTRSPPPPPKKKAEPKLQGPRSTSPSGQVQVGAEGPTHTGPVIYVQLDHSGSRNSFHKMEPVVYADIRKN
ncbi:myelin protein zero-like protein 1 isoform X1 [Entelurus aequoreus]|uniref:myelin protein zero-like 1 like isoform X1 n=1 Tax=Entelurus aequoreus TaxID=161455 RepID=UPI002B1E5FB9|nr:myelin protein zero-like 1 like isoform X1 [Entelurus aequoreus]XP_061905029.1 myelin protein zero-like protein 1 isoform X1 [Entelurus aequoreus]